MAAKKQTKKPSAPRKTRQAAIDRSTREITKAHKNLDLKLKKHKQVMSAMWFAI